MIRHQKIMRDLIIWPTRYQITNIAIVSNYG